VLEQVYRMFAFLRGKFVAKTPAQIIVDVNGVGYEVNISLQTYSAIEAINEGQLYTYLQVKEDAHSLFGFWSKEEKDMFILLLSVSGIGAATARMMLSTLKPEEVAAAISKNDIRLIESVKGIGKKTAERLVLELKDKVANKNFGSSGSLVSGISTNEAAAVQALQALGIAPKVAELAVKKTLTQQPSITKLEDIIKKALQSI
jgi:holliday junction DNA helicase RuvA